MATWIIGSIVIGLMILAGYTSFKKSKKSGCSGCSGCAHSDNCHRQ
jgi:hypothetical protein